MANYVFETTTQDQAAGFTAADFLIFTTTSVNAINIGVTSAAASGLTNSSITLTAGGKSLTFPQTALSGASQNNRVVFNDNSRLVLGDETSNAVGTFTGTTGVDVFYGFGGDDTLDGAGGADYLYGGFGVDSLSGGAGNDHIYGNALTSAQGALDVNGNPDGGDSINAGTGNDYVNGNAGNDRIDGDAGNDRLFGGAGNDTIIGGVGIDTIQGNQGADSIDGGAGNDILRGGQGNDVLLGGDAIADDPATPANEAVTSNDILYGDIGADVLDGGTGFDVLFGGTGVSGADAANSNTFVFAAGDSSIANIGQSGALANVVDIVGDYNDGVDKIDLDITVGAVYTNTTTPQVNLADALTFAQGILDDNAVANNTEVVALNVNGIAYLFAAQGTTGQIDTVIQFSNVNASAFNAATNGAVSDFI